MQKKQETFNLNEEEQSKLLGGEDYIIFANPKGGFYIWINCDQEMQIEISKEELMQIFPVIFPIANFPHLLESLNRGNYVYSDKVSFKQLRPSFDNSLAFSLPTAEDAVTNLKSFAKTSTTPYGFSF